MSKILVVFSSLFGANASLADDVARILEEAGAEVRVRGVKQIVLAEAQKADAKASPEATAADLKWADSYVLTSPAHTGMLSAAMKAFVDENHDEIDAGTFLNKAFTGMSTGAYAHAGQERVVDELNAIGSAWGCILVPPSTAFADLNASDGNPYGLSFVLDHGKLPEGPAVADALQVHLRRFVAVTEALAPLREAAPAAASGPATAAEVFG